LSASATNLLVQKIQRTWPVAVSRQNTKLKICGFSPSPQPTKMLPPSSESTGEDHSAAAAPFGPTPAVFVTGWLRAASAWRKSVTQSSVNDSWSRQ